MRPAGRCGPRDPELPVLRRSNGAYRLPKIPTNQPEARELQKADGLPAIKRPSFSHVGRYHPLLNSQLRQLLRRQFQPCGFLQHKAQSKIFFTKVATTSHPDSPD